MPLHPLTTQIVGSYAKPKWLARHERMRALDGSWWRPETEVLAEAKEDAVRLAVYEQERAGLDLVTDGEAQRAAYDRHFLSGLSGIDTARLEQSALASEIAGNPRSQDDTTAEYDAQSALKPTIVGQIGWLRPMAVEELQFLRRMASRPVKVNVIGALSLYCQTVDRFYDNQADAVLGFATALNQELRQLESAGANVIQIDEPAFHARWSLARRVGKSAIAKMVEGIAVPVIVHVCYGYAHVYRDKRQSETYPQVLELLSECPIAGISLEYEQPGHEPGLLKHCGGKHVVLGLLNHATDTIEMPAHIAGRIRDALNVVPPERLHASSDCGMWYTPRDIAFAKIKALVDGTELVRREIGQGGQHR
jgi:5-methyltetrahydropteroyltriglutamate--homocysteine methyltransferase